jgi:hypothetical protein
MLGGAATRRRGKMRFGVRQKLAQGVTNGRKNENQRSRTADARKLMPMGTFADIYSGISAFSIEHPLMASALTSVVTSSVVTALLGGLLDWWKRPIIRAQLDDKGGSHGPVTINAMDKQGNVIGQRKAKYLRLRITNTGRKTAKDCCGFMIKATRRVGDRVTHFDTEVHSLGWAHYAQSNKRDIARRASFHLDVATLLLNPSELYWERLPTNLHEFLFAHPGKATYRFDVRIDADNARQRVIPVEFTFDPRRSDLEFVALNTRYPWWRALWCCALDGPAEATDLIKCGRSFDLPVR